MKIKKKNGAINLSAENEVDSLHLLEFLENMAGQPDSEKLSIQKRKDLIDRGLIKASE